MNIVLTLNLSLDEILALLNLTGESFRISKNQNMREIFDISNNSIKIKSSILANFILNYNNKKNEVVELMIKLMKKLDYYSSTEKYKNIQFMLISQSAFELLVTKQKFKTLYETNIIKYYENIKNLDYCKNNIYFWIQYANVRISIKDFDAAKLYLERASSFKKENYHYQYDTCYARFILENQIFNKEASENNYDIFYEAHKLLYKNKNRKEKWYFPLKQTSLYYDYYDNFFISFSDKEKGLFIFNCKEIINKIEEYKLEQEKINGVIHWRVLEAYDKLNEIVNSNIT